MQNFQIGEQKANIKTSAFPPRSFMRTQLVLLRSKLESAFAGNIPSPFTYRDRKPTEIVSTGIPEIDFLAGGLPRGALTEICGPPCSGGTSLLVSALAARTSSSEVCALIDGCDSFDPHSAKTAGVELQQLLWVRCRNIDQAFRATDLLIQGGGFGLIALDLRGMPPETVRHVPLNVWFRFRRAVEDTPAILVVLEQESNAKTCASLVLQLAAERAHWVSTPAIQAPDDPLRHSPSCLLDNFELRAGILRSRMNIASPGLKTGTSNEASPSGAMVFHLRSLDGAGKPFQTLSSADRDAVFITRSIWSFK
jgi:recombination protein RecA